jgi:putative molybdopterin biosynthesis protein
VIGATLSQVIGVPCCLGGLFIAMLGVVPLAAGVGFVQLLTWGEIRAVPTPGRDGVEGGVRLRAARQARGFSQHQLAAMAGVSRQAISLVESGKSDPSLRVALGLAQALGLTVEDMFGPRAPAPAVSARPVAPLGAAGSRVVLAPMDGSFTALPLAGAACSGAGFEPTSGLIADSGAGQSHRGHPVPGFSHSLRAVQPVGPPRRALVLAGNDPALPLLKSPLGLLDPPVAFAWWPCHSDEALMLASEGLVHTAGVHLRSDPSAGSRARADELLRQGGEMIGFCSWRAGLAIRPQLAAEIMGIADVVRAGLRLVNWEPGAPARRALDAELAAHGIDPGQLPGYETRATSHLQVAAAIAAGMADAGMASEPAALTHGLAFLPLAVERTDLVIPATAQGSREAQALLRALSSPWLREQLASLPGYDPAPCGQRVASPRL